MPVRIQRKRTKGWRMSENTVVVGRPGKWGNPFVVGRDGDAAMCVAKYRQWLINTTPEAFAATLDRMRAQLGGKNLACWCPLDRPCHADVLLELANGAVEARG